MLEQMTDNPGPDLSPRWSPDERILAFLSRRNGERSPQIYFYSLPDKKTEKVTAERGTIRDLKWSPDKNRIAFLMTDSFTEEEAKRREEGDDAFVVDQDEKHTRLWTLDVERRTT
ncbi:MAG: S9 family peptidase, partial [Candidatus Aminicenantes bacterium]|nr:S9 family peptidase [Candidatus Aminicenantes bacterium]